MRSLSKLVIVTSMMFLSGCAGIDSVLFVTKTSLGVDFDSKPPTASIAYDREEGYLGPRYDNGAVPPVVARIQSDGKIFNTRVRQVYATGAAATIVANKDSQEGPKDLKGEKRLMFFGTSTTTGLKVTFNGQIPDSFHFGYKRKEVSFIPLGTTTNSSGEKIDVYPSVLASIDTAGTAETGPTAGLFAGQFFATGVAADYYAKDPAIQNLFKSEAQDAFARYYESLSHQEAEASQILRCYIGVKVQDLPEVWTDANHQGLFREDGLFAELQGLHRTAMTDLSVRDGNLRKAGKLYASDIAILDGSQPTRTEKLRNHRAKVCEITRR